MILLIKMKCLFKIFQEINQTTVELLGLLIRRRQFDTWQMEVTATKTPQSTFQTPHQSLTSWYVPTCSSMVRTDKHTLCHVTVKSLLSSSLLDCRLPNRKRWLSLSSDYHLPAGNNHIIVIENTTFSISISYYLCNGNYGSNISRFYGMLKNICSNPSNHFYSWNTSPCRIWRIQVG